MTDNEKPASPPGFFCNESSAVIQLSRLHIHFSLLETSVEVVPSVHPGLDEGVFQCDLRPSTALMNFWGPK